MLFSPGERAPHRSVAIVGMFEEQGAGSLEMFV
jgi:hypothetical protein